jgi:hypothetical protein
MCYMSIIIYEYQSIVYASKINWKVWYNINNTSTNNSIIVIYEYIIL